MTAIATGFRFLPSPHRFRATRSAAAIFRRPIRNICSRTAAITANWCHSQSRCRACLGIAMRTAISARGVAVVVIPGDVALCGMPCACALARHSRTQPADSSIVIRSYAKRLRFSTTPQKVTILGGAGCEGAHAELIAVAERLKAPIVHAMRGKEFIEYDNPYRRRYDRPAGIFLRLSRDDELRRAADARNRFSLSAVLSQERKDHSG